MAAKNNHQRPKQIIRSFEAKAMRKRTFSQKLADMLTGFFGSVWFLTLNIAFFVFWIVINSGILPGVIVFDPYPYVLLIMVVSLEAILLTIMVLITQKRQSHIATLRDELQLQVELITEKEISKALRMLNEILVKKGVKLTDQELEEMLGIVDTSYIEKKLEEQLGKK